MVSDDETTRFARMPLISSPTKLLTSNTTTSWEITRSLMASYYENTNTYAIVLNNHRIWDQGQMNKVNHFE
jgi:hypothetical protein